MITLRKYATASEVYVPVLAAGTPDFKSNPTIVAGDFTLELDGVDFGVADTLPTLVPAAGYMIKIPLSIAETTGETLIIRIIDAAGAEWEDQMLIVETYGHASARHPFDLGTATQDVNVTQISGDTTAADNLELQYDTTGVAGDTFPATQAQVGNLTAGTAAINRTAESFTVIGGDGTETNTFASTHEEDGVYHIVEDVGNNTNGYYQFDIGGNGVPVLVKWIGYAQGQTDEYTIWAYNYNAGPAAYEQIGTITAVNSTTPRTISFDLTTDQVGTSGADLGKVRFRILSADGSAFATDRLLLSHAIVAQSVGYSQGAIWVDSAGTAGSEVYVNGVADNPCPWANALVISAALGITRFEIASGTTITLDANSDGYTLFGNSWTLALGGQSIVGTFFEGASVSGTAAGTGVTQIFHDCLMGAVTHIKGTHLSECGIEGTQTVGEAGDYYLDRCHSGIAGTTTWIWEFGDAIGNTDLHVRNYSGGIQLESMGDTGTDTASIEGRGQIIEGTCTGGVVAIRGMFTTSGITNLTLSDDARFGVDQLAEIYEKAAVWLDTVNGTAGTQDFKNGTMNNPVDSIADALTIAGSVGLTHIDVSPGSTFTLPSNVDGFHFMGNRYVVALGGQSVSGTIFEHAQITGADDGSNSLPTAYLDCLMNDNTLGAHQMINCGLGGDITLTQTGMIDWIGCYSRIAGTATPSVDFGAALGNTSFNMRSYSGGIEVLNIGRAGTDNMSLEGYGQLVLNANCVGGTIALRGHFAVTDNVGGGFAGTLSDRVNFETLLDDGTTVYDRTTDSLQEIRDQVVTVDTVVDAIKAVTDALPNAGALTDISTSTDRLTAVRAQILTDWIDGERLDLILDATSTHSASDVTTDIMGNATDGVTLTKTLELVMSVLYGVATVSGSDVTFYARDGVTPMITVVVGVNAGERDSSTIA